MNVQCFLVVFLSPKIIQTLYPSRKVYMEGLQKKNHLSQNKQQNCLNNIHYLPLLEISAIFFAILKYVSHCEVLGEFFNHALNWSFPLVKSRYTSATTLKQNLNIHKWE